MKMEQKKVNNSAAAGRFCKKCGDPLTTANKHHLCDNCRRERMKKLRTGAGTVAMLAIAVVTGGKYIPGKK